MLELIGGQARFIKIIKKEFIMTFVGFKRMTVRILDGKADTKGTNLFVVEGKDGEGATQTANISGLSATPTKTYGSNIAYYVSSRGVGDVSVDLTMVDLPAAVNNAILGYQKKDGVTVIGADTEAPYCSILLESSNAKGETAYIGFLKGQFSKESVEFSTKKDSNDELPSESLKFTAIASDGTGTEGVYYAQYIGKETAPIAKLKEMLGHKTTATTAPRN